MVERVQRMFLRFTAFKLSIFHPPHDYGPVLRYLKISSVTDRRQALNLSVLIGILSGKINFPDLLSLINL